ncbi:MAG: DUF4398 domain-containing protein [Deltaproteobacteria bacterium]|nr:DUF4398 domain-containing protein [Nannocystaceae bacterium]
MHRRSSIALLTLLTGACASKQLPQTTLADTQAAMQAAQEIGAAKLPDSKLHLEYANDQLATAKRLMDDGDDKRAKRMLDRAHADAELALALARTERDRSAAKAAWLEVDGLKKPSSELQPSGETVNPLEGADSATTTPTTGTPVGGAATAGTAKETTR